MLSMFVNLPEQKERRQKAQEQAHHWVDQKFHLGFPISDMEKPKWTFVANSIYPVHEITEINTLEDILLAYQ